MLSTQRYTLYNFKHTHPPLHSVSTSNILQVVNQQLSSLLSSNPHEASIAQSQPASGAPLVYPFPVHVSILWNFSRKLWKTSDFHVPFTSALGKTVQKHFGSVLNRLSRRFTRISEFSQRDSTVRSTPVKFYLYFDWGGETWMKHWIYLRRWASDRGEESEE